MANHDMKKTGNQPMNTTQDKRATDGKAERDNTKNEQNTVTGARNPNSGGTERGSSAPKPRD